MKQIVRIILVLLVAFNTVSCRKGRKGVCEYASIKTFKPSSINTLGSVLDDSYFVLTTISESECNGASYNFYKSDNSSEEIRMSHWWENESAKSLGTDCCGYNSKDYSYQPGSDGILPPPNGYYVDVPADLKKIYTSSFPDLLAIGVKYGISQSVTTNTSGTGSGKCYVGKWRRVLSCNSSVYAYLTVNSGGTGNLSDLDCNSNCSRSFDFNWSDNNDGTLKITYTKGTICGSSALPNGGNQPYTCNGNSLTWGNVYEKY